MFQSGGKNIRVTAMNNLLPSTIEYHEKYDLKVNRTNYLMGLTTHTHCCRIYVTCVPEPSHTTCCLPANKQVLIFDAIFGSAITTIQLVDSLLLLLSIMIQQYVA